jgi:hypothetical protein
VDASTNRALSASIAVAKPARWRNTVPSVTASPEDGRFFLAMAPGTLYCLRIVPSDSRGSTFQPMVAAQR